MCERKPIDVNGLFYLEQRELINSFKRMIREPRRLLIFAPFVFLILRLLMPHPNSPIVPTTLASILKGLAVLLGAGLLLRFGFPAEPLYIAEPADLVFVLSSPLPPWQLMLRRHWVTVATFVPVVIGLIYLAAVIPANFGQSALILTYGLVYMVSLDQVGLISYQLARHRIPTALIGRIATLGFLVYAAWPLFQKLGAPFSRLIGSVRLGWLGDWILRGMTMSAWTLLWVAGALALATLTIISAPAINDVDISRVRLRALARQARRGEMSTADVARARAAARLQHKGRTESHTPYKFWGQGYVALAEAKLMMAFRGLRSRWIPVLLSIVAIGGGILVTHAGTHGPISALVFLSYISVFGIGTGPLMMTHPLLVGAPRTGGLLWAEEVPSLAQWLGLYFLIWTVAAVSGLSPSMIWFGYTWIIAFQIVLAAWRLLLWSLFPETNLRYTIGRVVSVLGGMLAAGIPLWGIGLIGFPWGIPVTLTTALLESWLIHRLTLGRITWAVSHSRVTGQE